MRVFLDSASIVEIERAQVRVDGFTTNPTLIRASGQGDYKAFVEAAVFHSVGKPISFEVVGDDWEREAELLAACGENVYVKIPCVRPDGRPAADLVSVLTSRGVKVNVTALMSWDRIVECTEAAGPEGIVSIFAGRVADTGQDPELLVGPAARRGPAKALWASVREPWNIYQAQRCGADIVTVSPGILAKYDECVGKGRDTYTLETVRQFQADADAAGLSL